MNQHQSAVLPSRGGTTTHARSFPGCSQDGLSRGGLVHSCVEVTFAASHAAAVNDFERTVNNIETICQSIS